MTPHKCQCRGKARHPERQLGVFPNCEPARHKSGSEREESLPGEPPMLAFGQAACMSLSAARRSKHAPDDDDVRSQFRILLFYPPPRRRDLGIIDCPTSNAGLDRSQYAAMRANKAIELPN